MRIIAFFLDDVSVSREDWFKEKGHDESKVLHDQKGEYLIHYEEVEPEEPGDSYSSTEVRVYLPKNIQEF